MTPETGFASVNGAQLYYELAGSGPPLVMLHAGIADCRMWDGEFELLSRSHRVLRYDMRGYGRSLPSPGEFNIQDDLRDLIKQVELDAPLILMGASMGAGLAIEFALTYPSRVKALILVGGGPRGFECDVAGPDALFAESEAAFAAGDAERVAEIDMRIWFDGFGRDGAVSDSEARRKAYDMALGVTRHELSGVGRHVRKGFDISPAQRLGELTMPTLVIVGENDLPYLLAAADFLCQELSNAERATIKNAAHLPNMEHPRQFIGIVSDFLSRL